jgi:hypothetical protein
MDMMGLVVDGMDVGPTLDGKDVGCVKASQPLTDILFSIERWLCLVVKFGVLKFIIMIL